MYQPTMKPTPKQADQLEKDPAKNNVKVKDSPIINKVENSNIKANKNVEILGENKIFNEDDLLSSPVQEKNNLEDFDLYSKIFRRVAFKSRSVDPYYSKM